MAFHLVKRTCFPAGMIPSFSCSLQGEGCPSLGNWVLLGHVCNFRYTFFTNVASCSLVIRPEFNSLFVPFTYCVVNTLSCKAFGKNVSNSIISNCI